MSTTLECGQTAGQLISLLEFGFLKVHQRLLRQELMISEIQANANVEAELTADRHNSLLNILQVIYKNTFGHSSNAGTKSMHESDFHEHVKKNLLAWTFEYSPLCFKIREILKTYQGSDEAQLHSELDGRRLKQYLTQLQADHATGVNSGRAGYFRFLHQVIKSMPSFASLPDKRAVHFVSSQLCEFWNCNLPYVKSHDNKYIGLISFQDVYEDMWRMMREKKNKITYRARKAASLVTPRVATLRKLKSEKKKNNSRLRGGSKLSSSASVLTDSGSELESGSESGESDLDCDGDSGSGSDSGSENLHRSAEGSIVSSGSRSASTGTRSKKASPRGESAFATPTSNCNSSGFYWPNERAQSQSSTTCSNEYEAGRNGLSQESNNSQGSLCSGRLTRSSAAKLSASVSPSAAASSALNKNCGNRRAGNGHNVDDEHCENARVEISPEQWSELFARSNNYVRVSSFHASITHTGNATGSRLATAAAELAADQGLSQGLSQASPTSEVSDISQASPSHQGGDSVAAAAAHIAAVSKLYERACEQERQILQETDAAVFARLRFLNDVIQPTASCPAAELLLEQANGANSESSVADSTIGNPVVMLASPDRSSAISVPVVVATSCVGGADAASSSSLMVRSPNAGKSPGVSTGTGTHTYFNSVEEAEEEEAEEEEGGEYDAQSGSEGEIQGRSAKKQRVAGTDNAPSRPNKNEHNSDAGSKASTPQQGGAPAASPHASVLISTVPVPPTSVVSAVGSKSPASPKAPTMAGEQARISASARPPTSSSSGSVCSSSGSVVSVGSNKSAYTLASSSSSRSSSSRSDYSVDSGTSQHSNLLSEHKGHKHHKHSKHHKHKRHRVEGADVGADDGSVAEGAAEEEKRKHKHKRKHRDRAGTFEEICAESLTQCSE